MHGQYTIPGSQHNTLNWALTGHHCKAVSCYWCTTDAEWERDGLTDRNEGARLRCIMIVQPIFALFRWMCHFILHTTCDNMLHVSNHWIQCWDIFPQATCFLTIAKVTQPRIEVWIRPVDRPTQAETHLIQAWSRPES